jgi:hypothetical protein
VSRVRPITLGHVAEGAELGHLKTAELAERARISLEALLLRVDGPAYRHVQRALDEVETVAAIVKDGIPQERCPLCGWRIEHVLYEDGYAIEARCGLGHVFSVLYAGKGREAQAR